MPVQQGEQGRHAARAILADLAGRPRQPFRYRDKGQLATIGRRRAVLQRGRLRLSGMVAWLLWLLVHIYFLVGFRNRMLVLMQWCWSYLTFSRGARLIEEKHWHSYRATALEAPLVRQRLAEIAGHPYLSPAPPAAVEDEDVEAQFKKVLAVIRAATGVDFSMYRDTTIKRRILREMLAHRFALGRAHGSE